MVVIGQTSDLTQEMSEDNVSQHILELRVLKDNTIQTVYRQVTSARNLHNMAFIIHKYTSTHRVNLCIQSLKNIIRY